MSELSKLTEYKFYIIKQLCFYIKTNQNKFKIIIYDITENRKNLGINLTKVSMTYAQRHKIQSILVHRIKAQLEGFKMSTYIFFQPNIFIKIKTEILSELFCRNRHILKF